MICSCFSLLSLDNNYIGKGQYGTVYKGIMEYGEDRAIEVAIKTLNQCPTKNDFKDFQREISVMKVFDLGFLNFTKIINLYCPILATRSSKHRQNYNID